MHWKKYFLIRIVSFHPWQLIEKLDEAAKRKNFINYIVTV